MAKKGYGSNDAKNLLDGVTGTQGAATGVTGTGDASNEALGALREFAAKKNGWLDTAEGFATTKPGAYTSKYQTRIDDVTGKLAGMGEYDYDPEADAAYRGYKAQYTQQADLANKNAQANVAARTGGYTSSYGVQAGQNAYNAQMSGLDNVLDSLMQQTRAEYDTKKNGYRQELSELQNAETRDYQNYQNDLQNWYKELDYRTQKEDRQQAEKQQKTSNFWGTLVDVASIALPLLAWFI